MDSIVKSVKDRITPTPPPQHTEAKLVAKDEPAMAVHPEMARFLNVNLLNNAHPDQLKAINDWAFSDTKNIGEALKKVKRLEIKLGQPSAGETRISKLYNWIRLNNMIQVSQNKLAQEINSIREKHQRTLQDIRTKYKEKINKISEELKKVTDEYRKVSRSYHSRTQSEISALKQEYMRQIQELKAMQEAYRGGK